MGDESGFDQVAATLREELLADPYLGLGGSEARATVETNSAFAERRGRLLIEMVRERYADGAARGRRVADLGCGVGALSMLFAFEGAHVVAVDAKAERLAVGRRVAERHDLAVELRQGRMEALDLPDESFEVAVMNNSLVYLVERDARLAALREARRILVPGGVLVMRNANRLYPVDQFTGIPLIHLLPPAEARRAARRLGSKRSNCRLLSPRASRRELLAAGFAGARLHAAVPAGPRALAAVARYTHFSALRPGVS